MWLNCSFGGIMEEETEKVLIVKESFELQVLKILEEYVKKSAKIYVPPEKIKTGKYVALSAK